MLKVHYTGENTKHDNVIRLSCNTPYLLYGAVLPEKLTGPQLVKKFQAFYETRRFITAFKTAHQGVSLS
jgi:hypothetical protein